MKHKGINATYMKVKVRLGKRLSLNLNTSLRNCPIELWRGTTERIEQGFILIPARGIVALSA